MRYLNSTYHHAARIRKIDRFCIWKFDFRDIKFPVKIKDIHKIEREEKFQSAFQKNTWKRHISLLVIEEENQSDYALVNLFNLLMYN